MELKSEDIGSLFIKDLNPQLSHLPETVLDSLKSIAKEYEGRTIQSKELTNITKTYNIDLASYYFLQLHYNKPINKSAFESYQFYFNALNNNRSIEELHKLKEYFVAFVPGFAWKEDVTTGADFDRQRRLLKSLEIEHCLIETDEWGLADTNAKFIANQLVHLNKKNQKIILVSASKGGLETSIALGKYVNHESINHLKYWISVGGILQGSPLADAYLNGYKYWFAKFMLWWKKKDRDFLKDISHDLRKETFKNLRFPKNVQRIHFVGIPESNAIGERIKKRYLSMVKNYGPNDGLTPLAEELTEGGIVIPEIGLDHYFQHPKIDQKTLALALMAISQS